MTIALAERDREPAPLPRIEVAAGGGGAGGAGGPGPHLKADRLASLDVFRGITIAAMLLVNNPGSWRHIYPPLRHADWHGWTITDLVFPFFLFIVGVAIPFSFAKRSAGPARDARGQLLARVWARALALFMLGELLTGFPSSGMTAVPDGFAMLAASRVASWAFCGLGIVLLLFPWHSRKASLLLPVIIAVLFYALATIIYFVNRNALANGLPGDFGFGNGLLRPENLRIPGVLQRIGICYGVAASIVLFVGWRTTLVAALLLMGGYAALMLKAPFPNHTTGSLTQEDNLARRIDETLLIRHARSSDDSGGVRAVNGKPATLWNHAYGAYPDPEGTLSTLPAIATVLIGVLVGTWLRTFRSTAERCAGVLVFGLFTLLLGIGLDRWLMPINKNLWTPSFTVFTAGLAMLVLGTCFYFVDVLGRRRWALPFVIYGMNAIAAFVAAGIVAKLMSLIVIHPAGAKGAVPLGTFLRDWAAASVVQANAALQHSGLRLVIDSPENQSLAFAILFVLAILVLMCVLYVLKIFVKV